MSDVHPLKPWCEIQAHARRDLDHFRSGYRLLGFESTSLQFASAMYGVLYGVHTTRQSVSTLLALR